MFNWLFEKKEVSDSLTEKSNNDLHNEINRLKSEYRAISNSTTDIDESLHRFELTLEIVRLADTLGIAIGNTYSGEVICDYQHAVNQIINRLWDIRFSEKVKFHNEPKALQIKASYLFNWKESNGKRWWSEDKEVHDYELSRVEVQKLISEITTVVKT